MQKVLAFVAALLSLIALPSSALDSPPPTFGDDDTGLLFTLHGSNTVGAKLAPNLVRDFLKAKGAHQIRIDALPTPNEYRVSGLTSTQHPANKVFVNIAAHGSSTGFRGLIQGAADIAMASRPIKKQEIESLVELGDMRSFAAEKVIAIDGLAVIVHPDNPVQELTIEQIARVFSGAIRNWQQLGGHNQTIHLYARDNNSGTWDTFKSLVLRKKYRLDSSAKRFESNDQLSASVISDLQGIGFVGLASVSTAKALRIADKNTRALLPTTLGVATEDYPLSRRLFMYTSPHPQNRHIQDFLEFAQSDAGQTQVERVGYVSQNPVSVPPGNARQGPSPYLTATENASRLSVNFRFRQGNADLDNKAQQDILRLATLMKKSEYDGKTVLLIGFGDEKQNPARAKVLSKLRAITVKSALKKQGIISAPVQGYGAFLPVADNSSPSKIKNRRVEVWLLN